MDAILQLQFIQTKDATYERLVCSHGYWSHEHELIDNVKSVLGYYVDVSVRPSTLE